MGGTCHLRPVSLNGVRTIERFFQDVAEALATCSPLQPLILDLAFVTFIPPEGIIALTTVARLWHSTTGRRVRLVNLRTEVHGYLERMDVFERCAEWLEEEHELADEERYDRSRASVNLLELLPIAGDDQQNAQDVTAAVERAGRIVTTWFDADSAAVGRLLTMLSEIASNVVHSHDRGFAVIQRYRSREVSHVGSRVVIAVGDLGIGIRASLRTRSGIPLLPDGVSLSTGSDFILHALNLGVTRRETPAGLGLYLVRSLVEEWQGSLVIRSHDSMIRMSADGFERADGLADITGTQVTITVRGSLEGV